MFLLGCAPKNHVWTGSLRLYPNHLSFPLPLVGGGLEGRLKRLRTIIKSKLWKIRAFTRPHCLLFLQVCVLFSWYLYSVEWVSPFRWCPPTPGVCVSQNLWRMWLAGFLLFGLFKPVFFSRFSCVLTAPLWNSRAPPAVNFRRLREYVSLYSDSSSLSHTEAVCSLNPSPPVLQIPHNLCVAHLAHPCFTGYLSLLNPDEPPPLCEGKANTNLVQKQW